MLHAGIDLHKKTSVVTVVDDEGHEMVKGHKLDNNAGEITEFFESFGGDIDAVLEAGPSWQWMCDLLDGLGIDNVLCHPAKVKAIASARIKTDKIDSSILAQLLRTDFLPLSFKPDLETRHLREMLRYRASLVRSRTGVKNRVHAILARLNLRHGFSDLFGKGGRSFLRGLELAPVYRRELDGYLELLDALGTLVALAEKDLNRAYQSCDEARLLSTIPGIGPILALTIISEIGDIDRFESAKQLSSYAGLVPSTSQSGAHSYHGHITKQGSPWLRWALVEGVIHSVAHKGPLSSYYVRTKARKGNKIARVACARKLATYIFHMLKENKTYAEVEAYLKSDLG